MQILFTVVGNQSNLFGLYLSIFTVSLILLFPLILSDIFPISYNDLFPILFVDYDLLFSLCSLHHFMIRFLHQLIYSKSMQV